MATCTARAGTTIDPAPAVQPMGRGVRPAFLPAALIVALGMLAVPYTGAAQVLGDSSALKLYGYAEVYFSYDLARPEDNERPDFLYNHKRTSEVAVNLALIRADYTRDRVRAAVGLMAGTYAQYNLAAEPPALQYLNEATVGLRLSRTRDLWLDAGVFASHIGSEGVIGADCPTLTRSVVAENSPYYEAGAKLTYKPNARWVLAGFMLNGWQQIQRPDGWTRLAGGTQLQYQSASGTTINWSTYAGAWGPDSLGATRLYSDLYATVKGDGFVSNLGFDLGLQQAMPGWTWEGWLSAWGVYRQRFAKRWWAVGRMEYFLDDDAVLIAGGLNSIGLSLGADVQITDNVLWRVEARSLNDTDKRYIDADGLPTTANWAFTTALCARF